MDRPRNDLRERATETDGNFFLMLIAHRPRARQPQGTKIWLLDLGTLEADAGWVLRGGNTSTKSNPDGPAKHDRRKLAM
jgi:hypothetical protein